MSLLEKILIVVALVGGFLVFTAYQEWTLSQIALDEPQALTVTELVRDGHGDNAHVVLGEFVCPDYYVYEESRGGGRFKQVWLPALPLDGPYHQQLIAAWEAEEAGGEPLEVAPPDDIRLIITSREREDDEAISALMAADTLQGLVINEIESLDRETSDLLTSEFPGLDTERVIIFEEGRTLLGANGALGLGAGGLAVALACVAVVVVGRRRARAAAVERAAD